MDVTNWEMMEMEWHVLAKRSLKQRMIEKMRLHGKCQDVDMLEMSVHFVSIGTPCGGGMMYLVGEAEGLR
jgi:hypothetical protein